MTTVNAVQSAAIYLSASKKDSSTQELDNTSTKTADYLSSSASHNGDTVTLSAAATVALAATSSTTASQAAYYAQFFPTRSGASASFGENVLDPAATTISTGLSASGIAQAARASMDAEYTSMEAGGKPFDYDSANGTDWYTLMSGLDRTALAAVSSNQGGLFSTKEQGMAQYIMLQQEQLATGNYSGSMDLESKFIPAPASGQGYSIDSNDAAVSNRSNVTYASTASSENLSTYLDKAGSYEKSTIGWAFSRASVQTAYEEEMGAANQPVDSKYVSTLTIVRMLSDLMKNAQKAHVSSNSSILNVTDLFNETWAKEHEATIQAALTTTRKELGFSQR
jgi:hypothetical protein